MLLQRVANTNRRQDTHRRATKRRRAHNSSAMCQQHVHSYRSQESRLARHVGTCNENKLFVFPRFEIVRYRLAGRYQRMRKVMRGNKGHPFVYNGITILRVVISVDAETDVLLDFTNGVYPA